MTQTENQLPLTKIQKLIGNLMLESKRHNPCCYMTIEADLTALNNVRKAFCKREKVRATTNDFFICAISRALIQFPLMTGRLLNDGDHIEIASEPGVGFAVAAPQGLVVPVVKRVTQLSLPEIARESDMLLKKARGSKLLPSDFDNDNIVLSSLGMYNLSSFHAIAPPRAGAIVSLGKLEQKVFPIGGSFVTRKVMNVGLSWNRRIAVETYAAQFFRRIIDLIEEPDLLTEDV